MFLDQVTAINKITFWVTLFHTNVPEYTLAVSILISWNHACFILLVNYDSRNPEFIFVQKYDNI